MSTLKYQIGQERDIVQENADYGNSVFYDQYVRALSLVDTYIKDKHLKSSQIISFCGDRGDGKTSCMTTVLNMIAIKDDDHSESAKFIAHQRLLNLEKAETYALEMIDPSFFDEDHNVLEIVIGHLYNAFKSFSKNSRGIDCRNKVLASFQQVKKSLCLLRDSNIETINGLHELDVLSSSILLKRQMQDLISDFLSYIKKDLLIIPIDDIDLNMAHAYKMCEQIRKYLSVPNCIVFIGVKIPQLLEAVECAISKTIDCSENVRTIISEHEIFEMSEKYINKLLPISGRVSMPKPYSMGDVALKIEGKDGNVIEYPALKEAVVELIFNRTRYLFYNPHDSISPIVPNNLRDLFNLVGLLVSMSEIADSKNPDEKHKLDTNKNLFKSYFYTVWINYLSELTKDSYNDIREKLNKLINFDFGTSLNKEVVSILSGKFSQFQNKDYNSTKEEEYEVVDRYIPESQISTGQFPKRTSSRITVYSITNSNNFGYNVSIGDVFYLFSLLEGETLSEGDYALVFFLKSFYSIRLYEAYDTITELKANVYPKQNEARIGLTVVDKRFDYTNKLQQLVGGSFFTYSPGDLMPKKKNAFAYDLRIVRGSKLHSLMSGLRKDFEDIKSLYDKSEEDILIKKFNLKLQIIEFFILSIKCSIRQKEALPYNNETIASAMEYLRANLEPFHYRRFYPTTGYFIFDILAVFANIINPRYTYLRFSEIDNSLFDTILNYNGSLLGKIVKECQPYREHIDYKDDIQRTRLHRLLSDATIRNAEVLTSVKENIVSGRSTSHDSAKTALQNFMTRIQESGMRTHKTGKDAEPYHIEFHFLKPIQELITLLTNDIEEDLKETQSLFWEIFDSMGQYTSKPPIKDVLKALRYSSRPSTLRKKLQEFDYFKKLTDSEIRRIIPDNNGNYSKAEIQVLLESYYNSGQEAREKGALGIDSPIDAAVQDIAANEDGQSDGSSVED